MSPRSDGQYKSARLWGNSAHTSRGRIRRAARARWACRGLRTRTAVGTYAPAFDRNFILGRSAAMHTESLPVVRPHIIVADGHQPAVPRASSRADEEEQALRISIMHLLSTLMLSPNRGVSQFAESLLKSERGIQFDSTIAEMEATGAAQIWSVMKVLHDFSPTEGQDHLAITKGDAVAVQFVGQRGWSYGRVVMDHAGALVPDSSAGWFPSAYAMAVQENSADGKNTEVRPSGFVTAVENNPHAQLQGAPGPSLQFHAGEIIAVWEEGSGGWLLGSVVMSNDSTLETGQASGWFPAELSTRFPPPLRIRPTPSTLDDEYSPFAQTAPQSFPVTPERPVRILPRILTQELSSDANGSTQHRTEDMEMGHHVTSGGTACDKDNMDVSDSDSDEASVAPSHSLHTSKKTQARVDEWILGATGPPGSTRTARSPSPQYHNKHSLSAVDDVTVHVTVTFTNDVLEQTQTAEAHELSLRRLAAALITSICRQLAVCERRFKVAQCFGQSTFCLAVLPYYVVSPSQAGAEISASQLGRKIVSLSRSDHGWVATMTPEPRVAASGYGIHADVICVEMSAAEAAALREQQMNDLSSSTSASSTPAGSNERRREIWTEPTARDSGGPGQHDQQSPYDEHLPLGMPVHAEATASDDFDDITPCSSHQNTPRSFAARHTPRISLLVETADNLPPVHHLPLYGSRPFVTLTIHSPDGDLTVCTKCVERSERAHCSSAAENAPYGSAHDSSDDDAVHRTEIVDAAVWNEEFVLDLQPHSIYNSQLVVDLCERCVRTGETLVMGRLEPAIRHVACEWGPHARYAAPAFLSVTSPSCTFSR